MIQKDRACSGDSYTKLKRTLSGRSRDLLVLGEPLKRPS